MNNTYFQKVPQFQVFSIEKFEKEKIVEYSKSKGYISADLDNLQLLTEKELCGAIGELMNFPEYYGKNWDALIECLGDLDWGDAEDIMGAIIFVDSSNHLLGKETGIDELAEIMEIAHERLYSPTGPLIGPAHRMLRLFIVQ